MNQTEDIKELVAALAKAQGKMEPAKFNRINPHFKNRYADFTSCMDACREPLSSNGLSIMQYCETINEKLVLVTLLAHTSGQWIKSHFPLNPMKMDSQGIGSAMTYAKRYSLSAMLGIVSDDEDDDAEAAHGRGNFSDNSRRSSIASKQETKIGAQKINPNQVNILKTLEEKLDGDCKKRLSTWMANTYGSPKIDDVPVEAFQKVFTGYENAVKFLEQQKVEVAHA